MLVLYGITFRGWMMQNGPVDIESSRHAGLLTSLYTDLRKEQSDVSDEWRSKKNYPLP
jgi:hypothetical protein